MAHRELKKRLRAFRVWTREFPGLAITTGSLRWLRWVRREKLHRMPRWRAIRENPRERWLIVNCHLTNGERVRNIRGERRSLCYVQDHKLGSALRGDVAHVFHTSIIGHSRFTDSFQNAQEWWFYADLASRSRMFSVEIHAKTVE